MNNLDLWTINANIQILTALVLIVLFLMYIAFKLSESGIKKTSKNPLEIFSSFQSADRQPQMKNKTKK